MYVTLYMYVTDIVYSQTVAHIVYIHVCIHYICMSQTVALNRDTYMCTHSLSFYNSIHVYTLYMCVTDYRTQSRHLHVYTT